MEREFQPGDKVLIRHDVKLKKILGSTLAASYWRPNRSVLSVVGHYENTTKLVMVRGPSQTGTEKVTQTIPGSSLEHVEKDDRKVGKACKISQLDRGARFLDENGDLIMKTDYSNSMNYARLVVLEGELAGLIYYMPDSTKVKPLYGHEPKPDPWEKAEVRYGDLSPGDLFRRARGDYPISVCVVVNKVDSLGNYLSMIDSAVTDGIGPEQIVYRDSILIENDA